MLGLVEARPRQSGGPWWEAGHRVQSCRHRGDDVDCSEGGTSRHGREKEERLRV